MPDDSATLKRLEYERAARRAVLQAIALGVGVVVIAVVVILSIA